SPPTTYIYILSLHDALPIYKIFAVISVCFLLVVMWMVFDDYIRPWKAVQIKALDIEKQKLLEQIKEIEGSIDSKQLNEIKDQIADRKSTRLNSSHVKISYAV